MRADAILLSHGFEALRIQPKRREKYLDAVACSYETGDLTPHVRFLLEQYPR